MNTFFKDITQTYGQQSVITLKNVMNTYDKAAKLTNKKYFLLQCRKQRLTPTFLSFKVKKIYFQNHQLRKRFQTVYERFITQTLNLLISDCFHQIKTNDVNKAQYENKASNVFDLHTLRTFLEFQQSKYEKTFQTTKDRHLRKLNKLKNNNQTQKHETSIPIERTWIQNLTKTPIPNNVETVLALGPKFAIPIDKKTEKTYISEIIASVECSIEKKNEDEKYDIRNKICNTIKNYKQKANKETVKHKELRKNIQETKSFLKRNPNIYVTQADKSKSTVLMEKNEYEEKMKNILSDTNTYKKLKKDPTAVLQRRNNTLIQKWSNEYLIGLTTVAKLKSHNAHPPQIYGLPKTHKDGVPLRPIVSFIQSPLYNLSKYLANVLKNIVGNTENSIKNSWEFSEFIKHQNVPKNYKLISLDVVSMYTNIPINLAMEMITTKKWKEIKQHTNLPKQEFLEAAKLCLNSTYFKFGNDYYEQIQGLPMGAPLSAVIANMVLEEVEKTSLKKCDFPVLLYKRYVDDIITAVPENQCETMLNLFNNYHGNLKFTIEKETNNNINFLDMSIKRYPNNDKLKIQWYTKPTWSGKYTHYQSNLPLIYKKSVVKNLTNRALTLTSPELRKETLDKVRNTLKKNDYPGPLVNGIIKSEVHQLYNNCKKTSKTKTLEKKEILTVPYIQDLTEKIKNVLTPYNIATVSKNHYNLKNLYTNLKTKTEKEKATHVIYSVPCVDCNGCYIGQTRQYLGNRLKAHENSCQGKNADKTALKEHHSNNGHNFDYNNTKILETERDEKKRLIKEMLQIKKERNSINYRTDIEKLSHLYNCILNTS